MDVIGFIATVAALAGFVLPLTQLLKKHFELKGRVVLLLSLTLGAVLGAVFAQGGMVGFNYLPAWPPVAGGAILGVLAGLMASGSKDLITGIQQNGAKARAQADATYNPGGDQPCATPALDGWQDATLEDLAQTRLDWPAVQLDDHR